MVAIALIVATVVVVSILRRPQHVDSELLFAGRDFRASPFGLTDAMTLCRAEMVQRYGDKVLLSYLDEMSSRWNPYERDFLIVLRALHGDSKQSQEVLIYCDIDPVQVEITYFKRQMRDERSFMERAGQLFQ